MQFINTRDSKNSGVHKLCSQNAEPSRKVNWDYTHHIPVSLSDNFHKSINIKIRYLVNSKEEEAIPICEFIF